MGSVDLKTANRSPYWVPNQIVVTAIWSIWFRKNYKAEVQIAEERCCEPVLILGMSEKSTFLGRLPSHQSEVRNSPLSAGDVG